MNRKKAYKWVVERDQGICQLCGRRAVDVHHIIPAGMGGKRKDEMWNMISLCRTCHDEAHRSKEQKQRCMAWSMERYGSLVADYEKAKRGYR